MIEIRYLPDVPFERILDNIMYIRSFFGLFELFLFFSWIEIQRLDLLIDSIMLSLVSDHFPIGYTSIRKKFDQY